MKDKNLQTIPITFEDIKEIDSRFMSVTIYLMHTGLNKNFSYFDKEVVEKCIPTLFNTPILGFIPITEDNELDFQGHKHILTVVDGEYKLRYAGAAYGTISESCNPRWEVKTCEDGIEREFLVCDGLLWRKFDDATEIMDRDEKKSQSIELADSYTGYMHEDGYFVFESFSFFGATILGESRIPAMTGACIEKTFEFDEIAKEINEQVELFKTTFSKGGNQVDELLALFEKYTTISEDVVNQLKENIESYSLEELDAKLFALSGLLQEELQRELSKETYRDSWGYEYGRFSLHDFDPEANLVYAFDWTDYCLYKFSFTKNGDSVSIDFESGVRQKLIPVDFVEGDTFEFSFVPKEKFETVANDLVAQKESIEQFETIKDELETLKSDYEVIKTQNEQLSEYKSKIEQEQFDININELFENYAKVLDEATLNEFKSKVGDYTLDTIVDLEKEMKLAFAESKLTFEKKQAKTPLSFEFDKQPATSDKPYADRIMKYKSKEEI